MQDEDGYDIPHLMCRCVERGECLDTCCCFGVGLRTEDTFEIDCSCRSMDDDGYELDCDDSRSLWSHR